MQQKEWFNKWFNKNLIVGPFPTIECQEQIIKNKEIDIVINVSDIHNVQYVENFNQTKIQYYWFPMNELKKDIGLNSIWAAMNILWHAEKNNRKVYLHCLKGINRSQTVADAYYFLRMSEHLQILTSYTMQNNEKNEGYINTLIKNCCLGYLPKKSEMENFLIETSKFLLHKSNALIKNFESGEIIGGCLDYCKIDTIDIVV